MNDSGEGFQRRPVRLSSTGETVEWGIAAETPVEIRLNGTPWTVMLASPCDVEDLAVGLALTERLISSAAAVLGITIATWLGELSVDLEIAVADLQLPARDGRSLAGNSGCGLCGVESLAALQLRRETANGQPSEPMPVTDAAVTAAFDALPEQQPINHATHSVHAAAWCSIDGLVVLVREDVGRHNALDKLVGALGRSGRLGEPGFVAMTSRCSYELVSKAAVAGASLLATISAPTTMALSWAQALGLPLACHGPGRAIVRFPEVSHVAG